MREAKGTTIDRCSADCAPLNVLCTCGHFHKDNDAGACTQKVGRKACPCKALEFDKSWQWHWSHPAMRAELDAGGDLHHCRTNNLWQLLTFDLECRLALRGYALGPQLEDAQRVKLRALAEARPDQPSAYSLWAELSIDHTWAGTVGEWLDAPHESAAEKAARSAQEAAAKASAELAQERAAVDAGAYQGPSKQASLF